MLAIRLRIYSSTRLGLYVVVLFRGNILHQGCSKVARVFAAALLFTFTFIHVDLNLGRHMMFTYSLTRNIL